MKEEGGRRRCCWRQNLQQSTILDRQSSIKNTYAEGRCAITGRRLQERYKRGRAATPPDDGNKQATPLPWLELSADTAVGAREKLCRQGLQPAARSRHQLACIAVMTSASGPTEWSAMHDVALLYLALAHGTDFEIDPAEQLTMVERMEAQFPDAHRSRMQRVFDEAMLTYLSGYSREMVDASMASIKESMDKGRRIALLNDLAELASADGAIVPGEVAFIQQLARFWEVDP